ncbi:Fibritin/6-phosphogluconate dehydrogenase C-terminal extension [Penicillium cf. griseofulvum]|uniref:6-phosphogluconate dehydrogenase, decarboxylating n=1 Tax=Penicillium cf. griseofulvum TaxID=2972120 RepID=A0A9W9J869_9EURO|nr:Fibritin/6-phosphogluconate dehydrogenase C-terminal extension [Penicillium cf. griseofulvum]KAJ5435172.1 Fibritin/6-phosphogluconate dehydrogenase C-terminal extension [Penicillium cf. griseofulvum]
MPLTIKSIGVVGAGNMGSMMTLRFAELGLLVSVWDVKKENVDEVVKYAKADQSITGKVQGFYDINQFSKSLEGKSDRKLFMFSITHGHPADKVLRMLKPDLKDGDIILDGGNENYRSTERRQKECAAIGVSWVGMGVSGGYQSARRGPSLSPGGDAKAIECVMPFLESYAAHDPKSGTPCVKRMGPGGSGHYIKMVHNGIEGGMLSVLAETWQYMHEGLGMDHGKIGNIFEKWNESGELRGNYLIKIGAHILHTRRTPKGDYKGEGASRDDGYVLDDVLDKVVQDDDNTEGTPLWCLMESASRHVSCPTLAAAHYLRITSGNRIERARAAKKLEMPIPKPIEGTRPHTEIIEHLRKAVYCAFLASFCQGLELISRASIDEGWNINLGDCLQIWRAGCIIKSDYIADLLQPPLAAQNELTNTKFVDAVAHELRQNFHSLKQVVMEGTKFDQYIPALSATLEYLKYEGGLGLPTKFMEAQMDYFGAHNYNRPGIPGEDPGLVHKGPHHYEWLPA